MADVSLRIVEGPEAAARLRTDDMEAALAKKPDLVFVGNTGNTPVLMYQRWGERGLDLSRVHLRMLDGYLVSPSRGFEAPDHPGSFTRFVVERILAALDPDKRPRDWTMPPEDVTTCEEIAQALEEDAMSCNRLRHPVTGEPGAEFVIDDAAEGPLGLVRRTCQAYDRLLDSEQLDIVSLGIGPMPYPHMAFNTGPYTRPEARTHMSLLDDATRVASAAGFGGDPNNVPPFALTTGPGTLVQAQEIWVTAIGASKSQPIAHSFGDPRASDFEFRSSIGYALRCKKVNLVLDEAAAAELCADGGLQGLELRYAEAGHQLDAGAH